MSNFSYDNRGWGIRARRGFLFAAAVFCFAVQLSHDAVSAELRLATFQSDVTLPLGDLLYSEPLKTVEHPLLAKGVILDDGRQRYVLCAIDWCVLENATFDLFRSKIAEAAGTDVSRVAVQCVHQHTAPIFDASAEELLAKQANAPPHRNLKSLADITDRLASAVREACDKFQPFDHVGLGRAKVERVAAIRRVFDENGNLHTRWSACRDPALRAMPEGNIDPHLRTVTFARGDVPLVRLHYYATHPQTYYRDGRASYDFPGMARETLQAEEGVFQIYFTGCSGDVTAGKYNEGTPEDRAALAERLLSGMKASITATQLAPLKDLQWSVVPVSLKARSDGASDPETNRKTLADPHAAPQARISAAGRLAGFERLRRPVELSRLRLGPAQILHLPGEPMIEYQHFAQACAADQFVAVAGYGLGTPGYVCTEKAFEEGGYEPSASAIVPESEHAIKEAIRVLLRNDSP